MPVLIFGIEKEAEFYCSASKLGLASDPKANEVINHLKDVYIEDGRIDMSIDEISDFIVILCENNVLDQISNSDDEQGVAWTIALLSKAYILASSVPCIYDDLFKRCFIKYYKY